MFSKLARSLRSFIQTSVFYYFLFLVLSLLILYPTLMLLTASFFTGQPGAWGKFTLGGYQELLDTEGIGEIIVNSFIYASTRTGISLTLALIFAWAVARTYIPGRGLMEVLLPIPFFIPDLLTAISWIMLANPQNGLINRFFIEVFGARGPVVNIYGWGGLIFHSVLHTTSFLYLLLVGFFYNMDPAYEEASIASGASPSQTTFKITLPMLLPAILGVSILSFIRALESFEDPYLFGTPARVYVFANEIYRVLRHRHPPQYNTATGLAVILMLLTFALVALQWKILGGRQFTTISAKGYQPRRVTPHRFIQWGIFGLFVIYFILAIAVPLTQICASSFFKVFGLYKLEHFTFDNWITVFHDPRAMGGLRNTIVFSTIAAAGVIALGGCIGYIRIRTRHWLGPTLELTAWLPWTMPGIVLGLALLWAWISLPQPFNLYGTSGIVILGFVVHGLPLGTRTMQSAIMQVSKDLEECSMAHGASWIQTMAYIVLPLLRIGVAAAFVIVFALSARSLTIPLLLYSYGTETLTIALLYYYEEGYRNITAVIAVIQLSLVMGLLLLERLTRPRLA
ncbi:MAG: iron ABC transporter permease [Deltaproteobacteria bacterium]|nr:iron ABC transporter permease [Deltaproteobacteria bacterium]